MKRRYFVCDDLNDLKSVERALKSQGVLTPQIHVLSNDDAGVESLNLHPVDAVMKQDVVHSVEVGGLIGVFASVAVLILGYFSGIALTVGWAPFILIAIILLGFCAWEGGMFGIQEPNRRFKRFQNLLTKGRHVLFVDFDPHQEKIVQRVMNNHPGIEAAGTGKAVPSWLIKGQDAFKRMMESLP